MIRIRNQKIKSVYVTILAFGIITLDQYTKYLIVSNLTLDDVITIIEGFFNIVHYRNTGIAFSMFAGDQYLMLRNIVLTAIAFFIIALLYSFLRTESNILLISGYSFIIGGATGNILDRLIRGNVVDFIQVHYKDVYYYPAFNVADSFITIGAILIVLSVLFAKPAQRS